VFSPDLRFVRRINMRAAPTAKLLPESRFLLHGSIGTSASFGHPYHVTNPDGVVELSFGYTGQPILPGRPTSMGSALTPTTDGKSLWGGPFRSSYHLTHRDIAGVVLDSIEFID